MVVEKRHFVNKLKELGYVFKDQLHYTEKYRLKGGTHLVHVPRKGKLDVEWVRSTLKQAGLLKADIEQFIRDANA